MQSTVMIIDDNAMMREFLSVFFGKEHEVITCKNGLEGLERLDEGIRPDLILLDLNMPALTGFEFLEQLSERGLSEKVRVMVLSGEQKSDDRIKSLSLGASDFLTKPFNPQELSLRTKNVLRARLQNA
jgi:DNA-binding response OmpR family regulator